MRIALLALLAPAMLGQLADADVITLASGREIECIVLQQSERSITALVGHVSVTFQRSSLSSVEISPVALATTLPADGKSSLPSWEFALKNLASKPWATNLQQIPATVIDVGILRNVPYQSYRAGEDYEMNVYGDPDRPCGIEIGVARGLLVDETAKSNCISFAASLMADHQIASIIRAMDRQKSLAKKNGLTLEITPATDPDAYGAWWISIYDETMLEKSRATREEMKAITIAKQEIRKKPSTMPARLSQSPGEPLADYPDSTSWSLSDVARSRSSGNGGEVYVHGYTRSNGTYVNSYMRSTPGHGGGGHR